jgi:hypothetical protein
MPVFKAAGKHAFFVIQPGRRDKPMRDELATDRGACFAPGRFTGIWPVALLAMRVNMLGFGLLG